jgi:hypothetical protein
MWNPSLQTDGLHVGAPTSALLAQIFLQYLEHNKMYNILQENNIIEC